jgi:hypothetical protein
MVTSERFARSISTGIKKVLSGTALALSLIAGGCDAEGIEGRLDTSSPIEYSTDTRSQDASSGDYNGPEEVQIDSSSMKDSASRGLSEQTAEVKCKTYSNPGTYEIKPCDKIVYGNYNLEVVDIVSGAAPTVLLKGEFNFGNGRKIRYNPLNLVKPGVFFKEPMHYLTLHGANIQLVDAVSTGEKSATVIVYDDCKKIYDDCIATLPQARCEAICHYSTEHPDRIYETRENVVISMPQSYSRAAALAAQNAQNCYDKIKELYGLELAHKIHLSYELGDNAGCNYGAYAGNVLCHVSEESSDENFAGNSQLQEISKEVSAGDCVHYVNTVTQSQTHEMTHNYAQGTMTILDKHLAEGLATFAAVELNDNGHKLICGDDNWYWEIKPDKVYPYKALNPDAYHTGACFLYELRDAIGEDNFNELFSYAHDLDQGKYFLFGDLINLIAGQDVLPLFQVKYQIIEDPEKTSFIEYN